MWWGGCEFRGRESVRRGKYPGFRVDSEEAMVTLGWLSCRAAVMAVKWKLKKMVRNRLASHRHGESEARQESTLLPVARACAPSPLKAIPETRVPVERISPARPASEERPLRLAPPPGRRRLSTRPHLARAARSHCATLAAPADTQ